MPRRSSSRETLLAALVLASAAIPGARTSAAADEPARPTIYRWIDENGIPHYTAHRDRIPSGLRERATEVAPAAPAAAPSERWIERNAGDTPPSPAAPLAPSGPAEDTARAADVAPSAAVPPRAGPDEDAPARVRGDSPASGSDLDGRIASLEREIARDEAALQDLLAAEPRADAPLAEQAEFREIAKRLPKRQAELRDLRERRSQLGRP